ncbi:MAG: hslO [Bacilli bacterium]|nr:hslO [Bacilli bacterium]
MPDYIVRGTALDGKVRVFAVQSTELVEELRRRQGTYPVVTAALGRTATMGAIMGIMLKGEEKLTIQISGKGPVGQIVVDANAFGDVRGYVTHPDVLGGANELGKLDVRGIVGTDGFLTVIKDLGMREPYRGQVELISGELGEDFAYYFSQSEQTPSAVGVGVLLNREDASVRVAGGFLIQLLPGLEDKEITEIERSVGQIPSVTSILADGTTPEGLLQRVFPDSLRLLEKVPIQFKCRCDRDRLKSVLVSLGEQELRDILVKEGHAEVVCTFCQDEYQFDKEDLQELLNQAVNR